MQLLGTRTGCSLGAREGRRKTRAESVFKYALERAAPRAVRPGAVRESAGGGGGGQRAGAVLAQQAQRAVEQVAHAVGQVRVDDVAEALLREVPVLIRRGMQLPTRSQAGQET